MRWLLYIVLFVVVYAAVSSCVHHHQAQAPTGWHVSGQVWT